MVEQYIEFNNVVDKNKGKDIELDNNYVHAMLEHYLEELLDKWPCTEVVGAAIRDNKVHVLLCNEAFEETTEGVELPVTKFP